MTEKIDSNASQTPKDEDTDYIEDCKSFESGEITEETPIGLTFKAVIRRYFLPTFAGNFVYGLLVVGSFAIVVNFILAPMRAEGYKPDSAFNFFIGAGTVIGFIVLSYVTAIIISPLAPKPKDFEPLERRRVFVLVASSLGAFIPCILITGFILRGIPAFEELMQVNEAAAWAIISPLAFIFCTMIALCICAFKERKFCDDIMKNYHKWIKSKKLNSQGQKRKGSALESRN